jgi:hypothetical protein
LSGNYYCPETGSQPVYVHVNINIGKPVNKGHPREIQSMALIDKWTLPGSYLFFLKK